MNFLHAAVAHLPWPAVVLLAGMAAAVPAAERGGMPALARLDLPQAGGLAGRLVDVPAEPIGSRTSFLWQSPAFARPLEFALDGVVGIRFPAPAEGSLPKAVGEWRIELVTGDQLVGGIESIDERHVVATVGPAESPTTVAVRRDAVRGLFRGEEGATVAGSGRLAGWQQMPADSWREKGGRLVSAVSGATLFRDLGAGPRSRYDLALSWQKRPTLRIAFGIGAAQESPDAYRLELGPEGMVAVREEKAAAGGKAGQADLEPCGDLPENGLAVTVFVDQQAGRLAVILADGREPIADLTIPPTDGKTGGGARLSVVNGEVSLDSLRVCPWRGGSLSPDDAREGAVRLRDGESLAGIVDVMGKSMLTVRAAGGETKSIPAEAIDEVIFPSAAVTAGDGKAAARTSVQVTDLWGSRLTGNMSRVEQGSIWIMHPAIDDPVPMSMATLATLASTAPTRESRKLPGRIGRLDCAEGTLWGCFVKDDGPSAGDGSNAVAAAAIAWQPLGSLTSSPFAIPADGQPQATVTYVETPAGDGSASVGDVVGGIGGQIGTINNRPAVFGLIPNAPAQRAGVRAGEVIVAIAPRGDGRFVDTAGLSMEDSQHLLRGRVGSRLQLRLQDNGEDKPRELELVRQQLSQLGRNPQLLQQALQAHDRLLPPEPVQVDQTAPDWFGSRLILRTGETLPCRVEAIDDQGVRVRVPGSEPVVVGGDWVQAVELVPAAMKALTGEKFRSLTVLPRSQRQQPPTHVLRSVQGDYLRGRLVAMDAQTVRIAVEANPKGKPLSIPRSDVSRLIWLHPENLETPWAPPQPTSSEGLLVESVSGTTQRLRMAATGIEGNLLVGTSPVAGPCRIDLEKIDRLLIGGQRDDSVRSLPYAQWKLKPAPEPRNLPPRNP